MALSKLEFIAALATGGLMQSICAWFFVVV